MDSVYRDESCELRRGLGEHLCWKDGQKTIRKDTPEKLKWSCWSWEEEFMRDVKLTRYLRGGVCV